MLKYLYANLFMDKFHNAYGIHYGERTDESYSREKAALKQNTYAKSSHATVAHWSLNNLSKDNQWDNS